MRMLIFYDSTGTIWTSMSVDTAPAGLEKYVFEIPEGAMLDHMDMADPEHPAPVYTVAESRDVMDDITDLQIALAEVYEMLLERGE